MNEQVQSPVKPHRRQGNLEEMGKGGFQMGRSEGRSG